MTRSNTGKLDMVVVLDNLRSAHNVGAIFRTADAAGVAKLFLLGSTPCPIDRFGRSVPELHKTALGAEQTVPWQYVATAEDLLLELDDYHLVAVEQTQAAQSLFTYVPPPALALVFGNEVDGVSQPLLAAATATVELPMWGVKESLNVSVSVGATLYTLRYRYYVTQQ